MSTTSAAFFRVEGVLAPVNALSCAAWMAANQRDLFGRLGRASGVAATALGRLGQVTGTETSARLAWRALAGCSEDRLVVLGEDWYRDRIEEHLNGPGMRLLESCRSQGQRIVLLSDHPRCAIEPIALQLDADELICNHLVIDDRVVTGELQEPVFTGHLDGGWVRRYAARHGLDPIACSAYGASASDATLLSGVGRPCTVTPNRALRRLASSLDWPVVEAR